MSNQTIPKKVVIGVQARSTSTRLPNKINAELGNQTVLSSVLSSVQTAMLYFNQSFGFRLNAESFYFLVVPEGDSGIPEGDFRIIEGPERDVLARYKKMADQTNADYIVRITADCPLIPSPVISNIMKVGVVNRYDYLANFFENDKLFRLVPDGYECEFFSRRMLNWTDANASHPTDREHVTTLMRTYPKWGRYGVVLPYGDNGNKKLSVDTEDDLKKVRLEHEIVENARKEAEGLFGKNSVHRF